MKHLVGLTLWRGRAADDRGAVRMCAKATPRGLALGVLRYGTDDNWSGLVLDRAQVQELRHALTSYLVDASPDVRT